MNYILAVFKSRFATLNFANLLKENNIPVAIINTPAQITRACGISVKFLGDYLPKVQSLFLRRPNNFDGFYSVIKSNGREQYFKI